MIRTSGDSYAIEPSLLPRAPSHLPRTPTPLCRPFKMSVSAEGTALFALFEALPADVQGAVVAKCPPAAAACLASGAR